MGQPLEHLIKEARCAKKEEKKPSELPCRDGFVSLWNKCYRLVRERKDWQSAALYCGAHGATLARYDSKKDAGLQSFFKLTPRLIVLSQEKCYDSHPQCYEWAQSGECKKNPNYMLSTCKKSCGTCEDDTCVNKNPSCISWAEKGECEKNPGYMVPNCRKACGRCDDDKRCVNKHVRCEHWAAYDQCKKNPKYMIPNCRKACGQCYGNNGSTVDYTGPVVTWVGGNTKVLSFGKRDGATPLQVDPPRMADQGNSNNKKGCFQASYHNGKLVLKPNPNCDEKLPFICGYDNTVDYSYDPLDYVVTEETFTYPEAIVKCNAINRPVASIINDEQQAAVHKLLKGNAWISAKYDAASGRFRWGDNSYIGYSNWEEGVPRHQKEWYRTHCSTIRHLSGQWNTNGCDKKYPVVCGPQETCINEHKNCQYWASIGECKKNPSYMLDKCRKACGQCHEKTKPLWFTPYYPVDGKFCVHAFKEKLRRLKEEDLVCEKPKVIECSAKSNNGDNWVTNTIQKYDTIKCSEDEIGCQEGREVDCSTFKVRFLCPQEEDQCKELNDLGAPACGGGRQCFPAPNHFVCRCPPDFVYSESSKKCVKFCGECNAWGDPHYTTLYGKKYDFMGKCRYKFNGVLNKDDFGDKPNYDIFTTNVPCSNEWRQDGTCLDVVEIHLRNIPVTSPCGWKGNQNFVFTVKVRGKAYELDGQTVTDQVKVKDDVFKAVVWSNYFSLVVYALDLKVLLNGNHLRVRVPDAFRGKLGGLCGDCGTDQFTLRNGTKVSVPQVKGRYKETAMGPVALDWMALTDEFKDQTCGWTHKQDKCSSEQKEKVKGAELCGIFRQENGPLQKCFDAAKLDANEFYLDCIYDLCELDDPKKAVCGVVQAFAQQCLAKGVPVSWRKSDFCPMDCGEDKVFTEDVSCPKLCGDVPGKHGDCDEEPVEGCICKDGLFLRGDKCVSKDQCGCKIQARNGDNIKTLPPKQSLVMPYCEEKVTCEEKVDGTLQTKYNAYKLPPNSVCTTDVPPKVECAHGFKLGADGKTCKREDCKKDFTNDYGMCLRNVDDKKQQWTVALSKCKRVGATLTYVDSAEKITSVKKLMKSKSWSANGMWLTGRVLATKTKCGLVMFKPAYSGYYKQGSFDWTNYNFHFTFMKKIKLHPVLKASEIPEKGKELSVIAQYNDGEIQFYAVPDCWHNNYFCEQW